MLSFHKRMLLFLIVCIGIRSTFALIAKQINVKYLPYLGYLSLLPAFGYVIHIYHRIKRIRC